MSTWSTAAVPIVTRSDVGEHDVRVLPAEFHGDLGDVLGGHLRDGPPGRQPAGERDEVDVRVVGQRAAEHRAAALHEVDHPGGHPASSSRWTKAMVDSGVTSLGLATIVQPAPSAGAIFHDICSSG